MSPKTLTLDESVSDGAYRVFGLLALQNYQKGKKTNIVHASTRELAEQKHCSHTTIRKWLKELALHGHIKILGTARGRASYKLTSPVFEYQVSVATAPGVTADVKSGKLPAIRDKRRKCPKCRLVTRIISSSGICERCLAEWASRTA